MDTIQLALQDIFRSILKKNEISINPDTAVLDIPGWDSIFHLRMIFETEKRFKIKFNAPEIIAIKKVGDLLDAINKKMDQNKDA